ncbi:5'-methylthioadenosine/S-adenosylhomocysteine nucleosidase [Pillotina sp. SPG140]|jgi:adenosylhomocysteine nucleosidase
MIAIIGAMENEIALIYERMHCERMELFGIFHIYQGTFEDKPICLVESGVGKVNATIACTILAYHYRPQLIINTGSAGGLDTSLNVGDTILASGIMHHDVDVRAFNYSAGQIPGMPAVFPVAEPLLLKTEEAINELIAEQVLPPTYCYTRGLIGSGDTFVHTPEHAASLRSQFPLMQAVDMESAAIAQTCFVLNLPLLVIRSLSDRANQESPTAFSQFLPTASKNSAEIVRRLVRNWSNV